MSRRSYPCLHDTKALPAVVLEERRKCVACDRRATHFARISYSFLRGEDESEYVCQRHEQMAWNQFGRFMAHMATRDKYLSDKAGKP
jgi:hypothetical protein